MKYRNQRVAGGPALLCALVLSMAAAASVAAERLAGTWVGEGDPMKLTLTEAAGGAVSGRLEDASASMPLTATRSGNVLRGTLGGAGNGVAFTARIEAARIVLQLGDGPGADSVSFVRPPGAAGTAIAVPAPSSTAPASASGAHAGTTAARPSSAATAAQRPGAAGGRHVSINGRLLSADELARLEQGYRVRLPDLDFWYDPVLGAWGLKGGPTRGFTTPGLDLGAPLPADASGGGTNVFVNGRELPPVDLLALQQLTGPVMPGRYFITAQGLAGFEGGPPLWDLRAMGARSQGGGGSYNSWQGGILGSSGFSQDGYGAVFLPGGGMVDYGPH